MMTVYVSQHYHHTGMSSNNMNIRNLCYRFFLCSFLWSSECHNGNIWFITCDEHIGGSKYKISGLKLLTNNDSINLCFEILYVF